MKVILQRLTTGINGTFGVIILDDKPMFVTCELPWKDNQSNISCIPAGTYQIVKMFSPRFRKDVFMIIDVPGRDAVELHVGNTIKDTHGCVLIGMQFSLAEYAIMNSSVAFDRFMSMVPSVGSTITIKDCENAKTTITTQI